jgi:hypothetical protein
MISFRENIDTVESGLTLLAQASLPLKSWSNSFSTAVYLINSLPTKVLKGISPIETLYKVKPDYQHLRSFDCPCFPYLRPYNTHKLNFRSRPCTFLGYGTKQKGYKCLDDNGKNIYNVFNEYVFSFRNADIKTTKKIYNPKVSIPDLPVCTDMPQTRETERTAGANESQLTMSKQPGHESPGLPSYLSQSPAHSSQQTHRVSEENSDRLQNQSGNNNNQANVEEQPQVRAGHPMVTKANGGIFKPKLYTAVTVSESLKHLSKLSCLQKIM